MNPSRLCKAVITVAVHELPVEHRSRYAREFYAEMYGMTQVHQLAYAGVVLTRAWSLAAALEGAHPEVADQRTGRDWRCRLRRHRYVRRNNPHAETPEAAFYRRCVRCGLIDDRYRSSPRWLVGILP
jgi:hypothetical protein